MDKDLLQYLIDDIKEVKKDVKDLLKWKWQVWGGAVVVGVIIQIAIGLVLK